MGEYKNSVGWHYNKGNIKELIEMANDTTIDEDDRELAKKLADKLKGEQNSNEYLENEERSEL